jgi:hypothetical protein
VQKGYGKACRKKLATASHTGLSHIWLPRFSRCLKTEARPFNAHRISMGKYNPEWSWPNLSLLLSEAL